MKGLKQFQYFDLERFLIGKTLVVVSIRDLTEYNSDAVIGKKVECAIVRDETDYAHGKDGEKVTNLYEKLLVKVKYPHTVNAAIGDEVVLMNATATVYGEYANKLSILAEGVEAAGQKAKG